MGTESVITASVLATRDFSATINLGMKIASRTVREMTDSRAIKEKADSITYGESKPDKGRLLALEQNSKSACNFFGSGKMDVIFIYGEYLYMIIQRKWDNSTHLGENYIVSEHVDMYVLGFQEIIPLNDGNIFGSEDSRPISKWENIIQESLNKISSGNKLKSVSNPPSPSRFKRSVDLHDIEEETVSESYNEGEEEIVQLDEEFTDGNIYGSGMAVDVCVPKKIDRLNCFRHKDSEGNTVESNIQYGNKLTKTLSVTEKIGLCWLELQLDILLQQNFERPNSFKSLISFKTSSSHSFRTYDSFNSTSNGKNEMQYDVALLDRIDLKYLIKWKRRAHM